MSEPRVHRLVLTGPLAGQTTNLRGCAFTDGVFEVYMPAEQFEGLATYLRRSFQAYVDGSDELKAAQKRDKQFAQENSNGERDNQGEVQPPEGGDEGDGDVQPEGQGTPEEGPTSIEGDVDAETGAEGGIPDRDGHEDSGLPESEHGGTVRSDSAELTDPMVEAVLSLDPEEDSHWTAAGQPAVAAVAVAIGDESVTRKDIKEGASGYDRESVREIKNGVSGQGSAVNTEEAPDELADMLA